MCTLWTLEKTIKIFKSLIKRLVVVTMTGVFSSNFLTQKKRERKSQISETQQQVNKKKKKKLCSKKNKKKGRANRSKPE